MKNTKFKNIAENLIDTFDEASLASIELFKKGLKIQIKEDGSPVSNGDLLVNEIITKKIKELTPEIPIISEETVNLNEENFHKDFWLIDPIDGTKLYIAGKNTYTLNAALIINYKPVIGLLAAPKLKKLFYSYGKNESYLLENNKKKKIKL